MARRDVTLEERFWSKVEKKKGCWIWLGAKKGRNNAYGKIWNGLFYEAAHRLSYRLKNGSIPEGLHIDHLCRTTLCVNPAHLEAVTNQENVLRGEGPTAINARKTHCIRGHEFAVTGSYKFKDGKACKQCRKDAYAEAMRTRTHCRMGHRLNDSNLIVMKNGQTRCKVCHLDRYERFKASNTQCKRGHKFTPENTWVGLDGRRRCNACREASVIRSNQKKKALRTNPEGPPEST